MFLRIVILMLFFVAGSCFSATPVLIASANFDDGKLPSSGGWYFGAQDGGTIQVVKDGSHDNSGGSLKATYPKPVGAMYVWAGCTISQLNTRDIYVQFWAKMPASKQGLKFFKVFGQSGVNSYANTTLAMVSDSTMRGSLSQVSFGDGTVAQNDTQNTINLDGTYPAWVGRAYGASNFSVSVPQKKAWLGTSLWKDTWHFFRVHIKFNSGETKATEVNDGEYFLEIDGTVYADAKGLFNRHYSNLPIRDVAFFDWSQGGDSAFEVWFDDIVISTGGFYDTTKSSVSPPPAPPNDTKLIVK